MATKIEITREIFTSLNEDISLKERINITLEKLNSKYKKKEDTRYIVEAITGSCIDISIDGDLPAKTLLNTFSERVVELKNCYIEKGELSYADDEYIFQRTVDCANFWTNGVRNLVINIPDIKNFKNENNVKLNSEGLLIRDIFPYNTKEKLEFPFTFQEYLDVMKETNFFDLGRCKVLERNHKKYGSIDGMMSAIKIKEDEKWRKNYEKTAGHTASKNSKLKIFKIVLPLLVVGVILLLLNNYYEDDRSESIQYKHYEANNRTYEANTKTVDTGGKSRAAAKTICDAEVYSMQDEIMNRCQTIECINREVAKAYNQCAARYGY